MKQDIVIRLKTWTHAVDAAPRVRSHGRGRMTRHTRGVTLVELLVVVAILATIIGLLAPLIWMPPIALSENGGSPPKTVHMWTVEHDGHWWIKSVEHFAHHPDCPCRSRQAERTDD